MPRTTTVTARVKAREEVAAGLRPIKSYEAPDGALALDYLLDEPDLTRECQFEDPRTGKECGADGTIYRVALITIKADAAHPIEVCPKHLPAVIVNPPRDPGAIWGVGIVQEPA